MKNELKTLYKKNPKLALQVAKVLGLKIRVKSAEEVDVWEGLNAAIRCCDLFANGLKGINRNLAKVFENQGKKYRNLVDQALGKATSDVWIARSALAGLAETAKLNTAPLTNEQKAAVHQLVELSKLLK